ncbi:hypothetical protein KFK09_021730 [Dendrobium nobile]|uniref:Uncharacterized protein n=1 Tax=Dendrobium nobile TaxID=94219 RepID=A0A8T3AGT1_DENNO|nr:hypothetical protein KFK09_021730 [Dendrobium nobile]
MQFRQSPALWWLNWLKPGVKFKPLSQILLSNLNRRFLMSKLFQWFDFGG